MQRISKVNLWRIVRRHYLITIIVTPIVALLLVRFWCVGIVLPVSGRVIDAVTGKPVGGIRMSLQLSRLVQGDIGTEIHSTTNTDELGSFRLPGTIFWPGFFMSDVREYVVKINEGAAPSGQAGASAEVEVMMNPKGTRIGVPAGNKAYFPLTLTFDRRQCNRVWAATCNYQKFRWGMTIPLIPALSDPSPCQGISDLTVRENCRQLIIFRSAFIHMDKTRDIASSEQICDDIDHGRFTEICRYQVGIYRVNEDPD
jgi:hypothetical protein